MYLKIVSIVLIIFSLIGCNKEIEERTEIINVKDGLFMHISHGMDNPHRVLMGLSMANKMIGERDVLVYFDITGIEVVLKDSPNIEYSHFEKSHEQIKMLLEKGATVMVCPGCLKAAGKSKEDVMEGVQIADKDKFFTFTKGRILSVDY